MSARTIRTLFAAPFVLTAACGKSDPTPKETRNPPAPAAPALRLYEITMDRSIACVAREICPPSTPACVPQKPYAFPCAYQPPARTDAPPMYSRLDNKRVPVANPPTGPDVEEEDLYDYSDTIAKLADGTCRTRPDSCTSLACLGTATPCPPAGEVKIPTWGWTIVRTGTTCTAQPLPATIASAAGAAVPYPCPADEEVIGIRRWSERCQVDNRVGKPPIVTPPGSTFNPPPPTYVDCPPDE